MEKRHILIEASDGTDCNFMGYTVASVRQTPIARVLPFKGPRFVLPVPLTASVPEKWWQAAWRILNTDIFDLWRLYGPKSTRRD